IFPNFDCNNTGGGTRLPGDGGSPTVSTPENPNPPQTALPGPLGGAQAFAPCYVAPPFSPQFGGTQFPQVTKDP
nr:hypothetical protein [Solirubrobacterales bacterium]